jgi:SAM-dependent methyltransferase
MGARSSTAKVKLAERVHRHDLYEAAVQDPECETRFLAGTFRRLRGRPALRLREDFCGTAALSVEWCRKDQNRSAIGVDVDAATLEFARRQRLAAAGPAVSTRIELREADVRDPDVPAADIVVAFNFSYSVFKDRRTLARYFEVVKDGLVDDGMFVLDAFAGPDATRMGIVRRRVEAPEKTGVRRFVYVWEQERYDPRTGECLCHIHFEMPDGSVLRNAFTYDWRHWTVPELRDLLLEAGFGRVRVFWEREDEDGDGTGAFFEPQDPEHEDQYWVYVVAEKETRDGT